MDYLKRAEAYAEAHGDESSFKDLFVCFRAFNNVEDSVWKTLAYLYGNESADLLLYQKK